MVATHLPHSTPTSAHRRSGKVKGLPTPVPATTGAQSLQAVPGQKAQPSGPGPWQGPVHPRAKSRVQKGPLPGRRMGAGGGGRGGRSALCGARATLKRGRRRCGTRGCRPCIAAARGAQPPPPARARLRQPRTLSLVLKAAVAPLAAPG